MAWSVQIPNPLTVGGNGDIGEIDILNADGSVKIRIDANGGISIFGTTGDKLFINDQPIVNSPYIDFVSRDGGGILGESVIQFFQNGNSPGNKQSVLGLYLYGPTTTFMELRTAGAAGPPTNIAEILIDPKVVAKDPNTGDHEIWHDVTFENTWSNFGSSYSNTQYHRMPDGTVRLRGVAKPGTTTDATTVFTLPVGYQPPALKHFEVTSPAGTAGTAILEIGADGQAKIYGLGAMGSIALDGLTFEYLLN